MVVILNPELSESAQDKALTLVKGLFKDLKVSKEESLGKKSLSYPIKRQTSGIFYMIAMEGETMPSDAEKKLLTNENVLRHLLVRKK